MKYPLTIITNDSSGQYLSSCRWPFMLLRPEYQDDAAIIAHEMTHIRQGAVLAALGLIPTAYLHWIGWPLWWAVPAVLMHLHSMLYTMSDTYRLWAEIQAYRNQAMGDDAALVRFAEHIPTAYGFSPPPDVADVLARLRS